MKHTLLNLGLCLLAAGAMNANVITCSNNPIAAGMYSTIQPACDAANVGDTVYVMGSLTTYGDVTIKKRITLIGAGYQVVQTQNNWNTIIGYIHMDSVAFGSPISGTKIMGLNANGIDNSGSAGAINRVDMERCYINYITMYGSGWIIRNCNVYNININNMSNVYIQNNFIGYINNSTSTSVLISNNEFSTYGSSCFSSISNALISNNIFYYSTATSGCTSCTFSNNITTNTTAQVLPTAGNSGSNNVNNTPPGFVDATIPASTVSWSTIWNYNWHIKPTGAAHNAGTDGTDMGVYGGTYPMPNLTGATNIPQMQALNVSGVVPAGGNLNVNFKARKQN